MTELEAQLLKIIEEQQTQIAAATAKFRSDANESYGGIVSTVKNNREHEQQLTADTKVISGNAEAILRGTAKYNTVHRADREQSAENGADHDLQRASIATSLTDAKEISQEVLRSQQNLLETSEILKEYHQDDGTEEGNKEAPT